MKTPIVDILLFIAADILSIISDITNSNDSPRWKQYWFPDRTLCFLRKFSNLLSKSFERIFENWDKAEIGILLPKMGFFICYEHWYDLCYFHFFRENSWVEG